MSAKYCYRILFCYLVGCLIFTPAAPAQNRPGSTRGGDAIGRSIGSLLGRLDRVAPIIPPALRPCRPPAACYQSTLYCEPQVSYLNSSAPAYNYTSPTYIQNTTNVYRGYDPVNNGSGITPAREWGGQAQTFVATRQIAGHGGPGKAIAPDAVYSSRPPRHQATDTTSSRRINSEAALENARAIGVAMGRGDKAFERSQYDEARAEYAKALIMSEEDPMARLSMGIAAFAQGEMMDAAEAVRETIMTQPPELVRHFDARKLYLKQDELQNHLTRLDRLAGENPQDADIALLLGFMHHSAGDDKKALEVLHKSESGSAADPAISQLIHILKDPATGHPGH
jgi:tetratricopeptide (TPR) repeat protein